MSQTRISILDLSTVASTAVVPYRGIGFNGEQIAVANAKIMGISKHAAAIGEPLEVGTLGTMTVESGAAFAKGTALVMDATGRVIAASMITAAAPGLGTLAVAAGAVAVTSAVANGAGSISGAPAAPVLSGGDLPQFVVGHALEAATAAGQYIEVLLSR